MTTLFFALPHENQGSMGTSFSEDNLLRQVLGRSIPSFSPTLNLEPGTWQPLQPFISRAARARACTGVL